MLLTALSQQAQPHTQVSQQLAHRVQTSANMEQVRDREMHAGKCGMRDPRNERFVSRFSLGWEDAHKLQSQSRQSAVAV